MFCRELQSELNSAAVDLSSAAAQLVGGVERAPTLAACSQHFGDAFNSLLGVSMEMAGQTEVLNAPLSPQMVEHSIKIYFLLWKPM